MKEKQKHPILTKIGIYLKPFASGRFLVCFGIAGILTNGIGYILAFAPIDGIPVALRTFANAYIIFIGVIGPEKLITIPMAIGFLVKLFKNHAATRKQLDTLLTEAKSDGAKTKAWIAAKFNKKKGGKK